MVALVIQKHSLFSSNIPLDLKRTRLENVLLKYKNETKHEELRELESEIIIGNFNIFNVKSFNNPEKLKGEFSFGRYIYATKEFVGVRDRIGIKTFFYSNTKDLFVYSTSLKVIKEIIKDVSVNQEYLEHVLTGTAPLPNETFYNEIERLPPAHILKYDKGELTIRKYWEPTPKKTTSQEAFNELLVSAINNRDTEISGSELSGGIDSSGISGVLARKNKQLFSFRHVMSDLWIDNYYPFLDERKYSNSQIAFSKNINIVNVDSTDKGIVAELIQQMSIMGSPFYSTMSLFSGGLYDAAKDKGVETLFSGFGGDELVSSTSFYYIQELINQKNWKELRRITEVDFFSIQNIKYYVRAFFPKLRIKKHWRAEQLQNHLLNKEININKILKSDAATKKFDTLNDYLISKIKGNTLLTRIEENGLALHAMGIEYTYPLFDTDLIECFLGLPSDVKYNNKLPRSVYRNAIKSYVPEEIYNREDKTGATVPTVFYRFMNDYDNIKEILIKYKNGKASEFLNFKKMFSILELIKKKAIGQPVAQRIDIRIFLMGLQMILYFDMDVLEDQ